jgi:hypothetical protein
MKNWLPLFCLIAIGFVPIKILGWTLLRVERKAETFIPKLISQTSNRIIPNKVADQFNKFAKGYKRIVYNDLEAREFLRLNYNSTLLRRYDSISKGPHRADLFRYAVLYLNGGLYLDIKTEILMPVDYTLSVGKKNNTIYTVLSKVNGTIYQGIIGAPRFQPIFLQLLEYMITANISSFEDYDINTRYFYDAIRSNLNLRILTEGENRSKNNGTSFFLFREVDHDVKKCYDGKDRYGGCHFVELFSEFVFKTRYAEYPWPEKRKRVKRGQKYLDLTVLMIAVVMIATVVKVLMTGNLVKRKQEE